MSLDEMKSKWNQRTGGGSYDEQSFKKMIKQQVRKHTSESFKYFWASFALQILVYSLLSHVVVKSWGDKLVVMSAVVGIMLFIPFTVVLMNKFKSMAVNSETSINNYVLRHHELLESFYKFKKRYELILIPLATLIGTFVTFELYVPGGIWLYPSGAGMAFVISLLACAVAIRQENEKSFDIPLSKLRLILDDLKS